MIKYISENKTFYLSTKNSSYIIKVLKDDMLLHWYYGAKIEAENVDMLNLFCKKEYMQGEFLDKENKKNYVSKDVAPMEFPISGNGDFRIPAIITENKFGQRVANLIYKNYRIIKGKKPLNGLPSFDVDTDNVDTLEIILEDTVSNYEVSLFYSVFEEEDAITRHTEIRNTSDTELKLLSAQSLSMDFQAQKFDFITLDGAWARERHINRRTLSTGTASIESRRGASGHQHNPFGALVDKNTTEDSGIAYGYSLCYSGNFKAVADVDQFGSTRFQIGINPYNFCWNLKAGEKFITPEAISVFSTDGLNGMSHCFHNMCKNHLGKSTLKTKRPLVINSWEAMYFNINEEKIENFVNACKGLGIDTFVLDDGWFGNRDDDFSSLGDWFLHKDKFPNGLDKVIDICHKNDMNFGIWFEPEMISEKSELFKAHPDWCIHVENKVPTESRNQLVLDMSRPEVVDYTYNQVADILSKYDISYVKWDMNRNITDTGSSALSAQDQNEFYHRYILGVYNLMDRLTNNFPNVLFEGCAGGGGRFDFGILYYMPQIWTSDDTDAIERLKIQYGTSLVYPLSAMTAHVSACPNHQTCRTTPFKTRGDVAQVCNFGYELDIAKLNDEEKALIKEQIALHRRLEDMISTGNFYRIDSPFENESASWQIVSQDKKTSFVLFATQKVTMNHNGHYVKLKGLDPEKVYTVNDEFKLHGNTLMNFGLPVINSMKDFKTVVFELKAN